MNTGLSQGKLIRWNDEKGFGFIESEPDKRGVFLHISALGSTSRRPHVGDIILYKRVVQANGKAKAEQASIQGLRHHASKRRKTLTSGTKNHHNSAPKRSNQRKKINVVTKLISLGTFAVLAIIFNQFQPSTSPPLTTSVSQPNCKIKGNISISSGKRWYHMPGMEDYANTVIDLSKGEKWFCSEQEAIAAGWKKAPL